MATTKQSKTKLTVRSFEMQQRAENDGYPLPNETAAALDLEHGASVIVASKRSLVEYLRRVAAVLDSQTSPSRHAVLDETRALLAEWDNYVSDPQISTEGAELTRDKVASAVAGLVQIVGPVQSPRRAPADARLDRDVHAAHLAWMLGEIVPFYDAGRVEKAMRWLGYVQGACVALGLCTIGAMKNLNKPDEAVEEQ